MIGLSNWKAGTRAQAQKIITIGVLLICAGLGVWLLVESHAATPALSTEPETGTVHAPATVITDGTASGGRAVQFKSPQISDVPATDGRYVVVTDVAAHKIFVLDPKGTWSTSAALWSWSPNDSPQIAQSDKKWFMTPTEAKLIDASQDLLVTSTNSNLTGNQGGVAIIRLRDKAVLFYAAGGLHTHTAERLPDGSLVTVSTTDNVLRIMSTDPTVSHFPSNVVSHDLGLSAGVDKPHGAIWDPVTNRLWTVNNTGIQAYTYNGNPKDPQLALDTHIGKIPFPASTHPWDGHDLYPVLGERKLFLTDTDYAYVFDLATQKINSYIPAGRTGLKAMGINPDKQIVTNTLTTNIFFGTPGNPNLTTKTLTGEKIYKARWWIETTL